MIKPISKQSSPMENFQKVQEAEKERLKIEAEAKEKRINFKAFGGPDASKSSTNAAHDTLNAQLEGLRRKHVLKTRYDNHTSTPSEVEREKAKSIRKYQLELEDSEEERFMRLARVAKEWRDKKGGAKIVERNRINVGRRQNDTEGTLISRSRERFPRRLAVVYDAVHTFLSCFHTKA